MTTEEAGREVAIRTVALDSYTPDELQSRLVELKREGEILQNFFKSVMVANHDYGVIPGTGKPTLLKPGAEKLAEYYGYAPIVKEPVAETIDTTTGFYRARVTVQLVSKRTGTVVAEGVGEANTKEGRYRWRDAQRTCPECNAAAIIKGRAEYGGGWLCFAKKGGCGAKFDDKDPSIIDQPLGRIENDDPFTLWNTVLKMGKKRALLDAVLSATRSSGVFTQDMDELTGWVGAGVDDDGPPQRSAEPAQEQAPRPPAPTGEPATREQMMASIKEFQSAIQNQGSGGVLKAAGVVQWAKEQFPSAVEEGKFSAVRLTDEQAGRYLDHLKLAYSARR